MNFMSLVSGQMLASPTPVDSVLKFVCTTHHSANLVHAIRGHDDIIVDIIVDIIMRA